MRWMKIAFFALVVLAVLAVGAVFLIPTDRIARLAEARFEAMTGRQLTIAGAVSPVIWPRLGVALEDVSISNAEWAGPEPMLEAARLDVGVGAAALLGGAVNVETFQIDAPVIRLVRAADGQANWDFLTALGGDGSDSAAGGEIGPVSLPKGRITGATLTFTDAAAGIDKRIEALDATLRLENLDGEGQVTLNALMDGQDLSLDGTIARLMPFLDGAVQPVQIAASVGGNKVSFDGAAGLEPMQATGQLEASIADHASLFALIDSKPPRIPEGLGQRVALAGTLTLTDAPAVFLREATIALDQNQLAGDVDIDLSEAVPSVMARLSGDVLDFSAMSTDTSAGDGAANTESGGWSTARLDVSGLSNVNGQFAFLANAVDLGSIQLGPTVMQGNLDRARLVMTLEDVTAFDGKISGQFVVNNRSGLSVGGELRARNVAMQRLLTDFAGFDRLIADGGMSLKFLGVGENMDEIMRSLSGSGTLDVGAGEMLGLDIAGMIRNLDAAYVGEGSKTVFDAITAGFDIQNGVLRNSDLQFTAPLLTATGAGEMDLGRQTVDYRLIPVALASAIENGISVPVLITGPWADIRFRPDLKSLLDRELEDEKAKLQAAAKAREAELKERAKAKIAAELDIVPTQDADVEELLKDGLENKAKDALRRLFD